MNNKFAEGSVVHAIITPDTKLIIRRYIDEIYYCKVKDNPDRKELVYFERELAAD